MAFPRATFFFKDPNSQGWSETYYGASAIADLTQFRDNAEKLAKLRVKCILRGPQLHYARVSMDDVVGDSFLLDVPTPYQDGSYNKDLSGSGTGEGSDLSYSTLLLRMSSGSMYRKNLYMSGNPDAGQSLNVPQINYEAAWTKAYNQFKLELISGRWAIKSLAKTDDLAPLKSVTKFQLVLGQGNVTSNSHGFVGGDKVRIYQCKTDTVSNRSINGIWTISNVPDANTFSLLGWGVTDTYSIINVGKVRKQVHTLATIDSVIQRKLTSHKRGIPFGVSRGRSRNRKKV